jgi:uncharacterized membrane protein YedE/YeeE
MGEANLMGGFIGGVLIGIAAVLLLVLNGRIAGISGILGGLFTPGDAAGRWWRLAFLVGLVAGAGSYSLMHGDLQVELPASGATLVVAGLFVGFGTRLGSGCTSGHGVCGLARLSPRSLLATVTFMGAGVVTVYFLRHILS